ncbi:MAG: TatD family hydrolase [Bradymonadaceae bacterium]
MFDAHCHLDFEAFDDDREEAIDLARQIGLRGLIIAGYDRRRRSLARELATRPGIWATAGLHPWAVAGHDRPWLDEELHELSRDLSDNLEDWCGLGELGLDFHRVKDGPGRELQEAAFIAQLGIARELDLPLVIHAVKAHNTLYDILRREGLPRAGGIMHGYSGSARQVGLFLMLNLDISIGTPVTFGHTAKIEAVLRATPMDRLLIETDAPDRAPHPHRDQRNELHYLRFVMEEVARFKEIDVDELARHSESNVRRRFRLGAEVL